jgi:DNA-binding transcriptional regulator YiaG
MPEEEEEWRPIPGFWGYEASDMGNVRSWRFGNSKNRLADRPRTLKPKTDKDGYKCVALGLNGKTKWLRIPALVLEAFVGPRPDGMLALHYPDHNRANNKLGNLRWGTHKENSADMIAQGRSMTGAKHHRCMAKLTESHVNEIRALLATKTLSQRAIAERFGVKQQAISKINRGDRWWHLKAS